VDLRLTENHGVDPRGHGEEVLGGVVLVVGVQGLGELVGRDLARLREEPLHVQETMVIAGNRGVDLHPVAGGEDHGLLDGSEGPQVVVGLGKVLLGEGQPLQQLHRGSAVGNP
jgi:hypothetical protein